MRQLIATGLLIAIGMAGPHLAHAQADSTYVVRQGDTLYGIARQFDTSVEALRRWNDLPSTDVQAGQTLRVRPPAAQPPEARDASDVATHVVQPGETLYSIARQHGVSVRALQRWSDLDSTDLAVGQRLRVRPPEGPPQAPSPPDSSVADEGVGTPDEEADTLAAQADTSAAPDTSTALPPPPSVRPDTVASAETPDDRPPGGRQQTVEPPQRRPSYAETMRPVEPVPSERTLISQPIDRLRHGTHVIEPGDTFFTLAARYSTTADTLFVLNGRFTDPLPPGQVVRLPERFSVPSHVAQSGEDLYAIAAQYGVSVRALRSANALDTTAVAPGQRLQIPGRPAPDPPERALPEPEARGPVAIYPDTFEGRLTAGGTPYDARALVVSHPALPFGAVVLLTNPATGQSTFAQVADRGPVEEEMLADVSAAVAERLGITRGSNQPIELRVVR